MGLRFPEATEILRHNSQVHALGVNKEFLERPLIDVLSGRFETGLRELKLGMQQQLGSGSSRVVIELRDPDSF